MIKNKKILIITFTIIVSMLLMPNKSKAGLQANKGGTSLVNATADQFFTGIRKMETQYGTLGKSANLDSKALDTTENGIDAHMALNTEWGTVALLTDSIFGVGTSISGTSNATSTGNESGVYNLADGKYEDVAVIMYGGGTTGYSKTIYSSDRRYSNSYQNNTTRKPGDALGCRKWLGTNAITWPSSNIHIFARGYGGLFGFGAATGGADSYIGSRAVVVCGSRTLGTLCSAF